MFLSSADYKLKPRHIVYVIIGLLGASFLSYFSQVVQIGGFVFFTLFCLILGLWKREYALYLAFLELTLGSFGYLLSIQAGGLKILSGVEGLNLSLRYAFFVIIMGLWLLDIIKSLPTSLFQREENRLRLKLPHFKKGGRGGILFALSVFLIVWILGIIQGYLRGNNLANIIFDANGYLYLLMILPAITYIDTREKLLWFSKTLFLGICVLAFFSLGLFIVFAKSQSTGFLEILYKWVRDFRLGEITPLKNGIYRIFLQSQIFLLPGIFLVFIRNMRKKISRLSFILCGATLSAAIYICLSRSLWIGYGVGVIILAVLAVYLKTNKIVLMKRGMEAAAVAVIGILAIGFFIPKNSSLLFNRFQIGESASDTRIAELTPLFSAIKVHPVLGYGFGKTLTFVSFDPRVGGKPYTTYAFEWGYLDMVLKFGILGLAAYLYFILTIAWRLFKKLSARGGPALGGKEDSFYSLWAITSLAALLAVHIFTPYLNHPLGIGIVILSGVIANVDREK